VRTLGWLPVPPTRNRLAPIRFRLIGPVPNVLDHRVCRSSPAIGPVAQLTPPEDDLRAAYRRSRCRGPGRLVADEPTRTPSNHPIPAKHSKINPWVRVYWCQGASKRTPMIRLDRLASGKSEECRECEARIACLRRLHRPHRPGPLPTRTTRYPRRRGPLLTSTTRYPKMTATDSATARSTGAERHARRSRESSGRYEDRSVPFRPIREASPVARGSGQRPAMLAEAGSSADGRRGHSERHDGIHDDSVAPP
jgi:hypothetical protein